MGFRGAFLVICFGLFIFPSSLLAAKNVILLVGDGMALEHIGFFMTVRKGMKAEPTSLEKVLATAPTGFVKTGSLGFAITDSAAAATAIACGRKTLPDVLGMDGKGRALESTLEKAEKEGFWTGVISTHRISDATPAAFYASLPTRDWHDRVVEQLLDSGIEVALGGGLRYFIPKGDKVSSRFPFMTVWSDYADKSGRRDERNLLGEFAAAGYHLVHDRDTLAEVDALETKKLLGLFSPHDMSFELDRRSEDHWQPTLAEMTDKALDIMDRSPKGFFLLVEGASIDTTAHHNDAAAMLGEMKAFDDALSRCLDYAREKRDTLVIVTADHGTGGPGFAYHVKWKDKMSRKLSEDYTWKEGYDYVPYAPVAEILSKQRASFSRIALKSKLKAEKLLQVVKKYSSYDFSLEDARKVLRKAPSKWGPKVDDEWFDFYPNKYYYRYGSLAKILGRQTGVVWGTGTHTGTPVPIMAVGPSSSAVRGLHDNTWLHHYMNHALGLEEPR